MEYFLPNIDEAGRHKASKQSGFSTRKIALHIEEEVIPIAEFDQTGFAVDKKYRLPKRANVEIWEGATSLYQGMIHYAVEEREFQRFEFKRLNPAMSRAPRDYADEDGMIAGLLTTR